MKTLSNSAFAIVLLTALAIPPFALAASIVPIFQHPEAAVKTSCAGVFYPSTKGNGGVYGCAYQDGNGHGIVCGGSGKDAQTCTIYTAPFPKLPTQAQAGAAKPIVNNGSRNPAQPK